MTPRHATAFYVATALLALGCSDKTALELQIVSSSLAAPQDVDALTINVTSNAGRAASMRYPIASLPQSLVVRPSEGEQADGVIVRVVAWKGEAQVLRRVLRTQFGAGGRTSLVVALERACSNVACPFDVDCVDGVCVSGAPPDAGMGRD